MYTCVSPQLAGVESRLGELETSHKELTDHKYRSQAAIRELKAKLKASEEVGSVNIVYVYINRIAGILILVEVYIWRIDGLVSIPAK